MTVQHSPVLEGWAGNLFFCWRSLNNGKLLGLNKRRILKAVNMKKIPLSKKTYESQRNSIEQLLCYEFFWML